MKSQTILTTIIILFQCSLFGQVGINTGNTAPDASSILDVSSADKGMLVPRLTTEKRTMIFEPATGLLVFDIDTGGFWFYDGDAWANLSSNDADSDPTNEYNSTIILNGTNLETEDGGGTIITNLSGLQDVDWLRTNGTIATSINNSIYTNGNVGFGISSPSFPVDVQGTGGERIRAYTTDGFYAGIISKNSTREFFAGVQADYETNDASSGYHIYDNTSGSQRFVIDKDGDIGIGQANPNAKLHVNGDFRLVDGTQGAGKFLTSNASGFASWVTTTDNVDDADADPTNEIELPAVGISGQFLQTDGAGVSTWATPSDNVDDADADPTNEIELPAGGTVGQLLSTDGAGTFSWVTDNTVDNLGNHTATQNITLGTNHISNDGGSSGIYLNASNRVGINETSPDDLLHVTSGGNGTRVRAENSSNGWAGFVSKNNVGEMFIGVQGAFDANPGELHFYDNVAGARRMVIDAAGEVGIGKNNPSVKLDVNGSVNCTGGTCSSDLRWKKNVLPLENALEKVLLMRGVSYDWRTSSFPDKDFSDDRQIGLIAQEVEAIFPELIKTDNEGFKSMDYMSFTAILLESVKALKQENEAQEASNQALTTELNELKDKMAKFELQNAKIEAMLSNSKLTDIEVASNEK